MPDWIIVDVAPMVIITGVLIWHIQLNDQARKRDREHYALEREKSRLYSKLMRMENDGIPESNRNYRKVLARLAELGEAYTA